MAKTSKITLDRQLAELKRAQLVIEEKQKITSGIIKIELPSAKAKVYEYLDTLATVGVAEDITATLFHIANVRAEKGIRLPVLRKLGFDQVALDDARKELRIGKYIAIENGKSVEKTGAGYIEEKDGDSSIIITITEAGKAAFEAANAPAQN